MPDRDSMRCTLMLGNKLGEDFLHIFLLAKMRAKISFWRFERLLRLNPTLREFCQAIFASAKLTGICRFNIHISPFCMVTYVTFLVIFVFGNWVLPFTVAKLLHVLDRDRADAPRQNQIPKLFKRAMNF